MAFCKLGIYLMASDDMNFLLVATNFVLSSEARVRKTVQNSYR
jgi:hypothetical protein